MVSSHNTGPGAGCPSAGRCQILAEGGGIEPHTFQCYLLSKQAPEPTGHPPCFRAAPRPVVVQRTESPISTEVLNAALSSWPHAATEVSHRPSVFIIPRRKQWESNPRNLPVQTASNGCPRPCRATSAVVYCLSLISSTLIVNIPF